MDIVIFNIFCSKVTKLLNFNAEINTLDTKDLFDRSIKFFKCWPPDFFTLRLHCITSLTDLQISVHKKTVADTDSVSIFLLPIAMASVYVTPVTSGTNA